MPSARPSSFKGGGGILRDVDGTITDVTFTDKNPLWVGPPPAGKKKSSFRSLWAVLNVLQDGAEVALQQPLFVGDADAFEVIESGRGISGEAQLSKSSGWFIFLNSLVEAGFPEESFPEDPEGLVADYDALVGARVRFNWQTNEKATKKYGKKVSTKDPKKSYDREDLIVTNYYGQTEEIPTPATKTAAKPARSAAPASKAAASGKANGKIKAAPSVDIAALAAEQAVLALASVKDKKLTKSKLSVKLLAQMENANPEVRSDVREYLMVDANLAAVEGVEYDAASQVVSLEV